MITRPGRSGRPHGSKALPGRLIPTQDEVGRVRDVLYLLRHATRRSDGGPQVRFGVHVRNGNRERTPPLVRLKTLSGPDDNGSPCITVLLPDED
jgi:hypothetical protein